MTYEIIPITSTTLADGTITVSGVFWLQAPTNCIVLQPSITSQFKKITPAQLAALQNGTIVEVPFQTCLYEAGTSNADIFTDLQSQYATAQTNLNNSAPVSSGLIGVVYDGYNWVTPTSALMTTTQQVTLTNVPTSSDGRPNFLPTLFPTNVQLTIIGAGDDPTLGNGMGTPFTHQSNDGYLTTHTITWGHNDYLYLAGGTVVYTNAVIGDFIDYWIYAPATPVTTVVGTGNVNLVGPGSVLIVPGANTNNNVDLTAAVPVPNVAGTGFWDWTPPASGVGKGTITPNVTQTGGYDLYTIQLNLTHPVTAYQLNGTNAVDLVIPALIPRKVLPQWQHKVIVTNSGHSGLQITWVLTIARVKNT